MTINVLPADVSADKERVTRFEQEALAAGALNHPNILGIHDVDTQGGGFHVVSELLEGDRSAIRRSRAPRGNEAMSGEKLAKS